MTTTQIFVYGTLKLDGWNHRLIESFVLDSHPAIIRGVLVDLGSIPALVEGEGIVEGVLLTMDRRALPITDRLEGYSAGREQNLYRRERIEVTLADASQTEAWVYRYAHPEGVQDRPKLVVGQSDGTAVYRWQGL